jgi:protein KRI1
MKTIESIRKKDPKIYDSKTKWYHSDEEESEEEAEVKGVKSNTTKKKTYKDILREQLLSGGEADQQHPSHSKRSALQYDEEQEALRKSFLSSANEILSSGSEASDGDDGDDDLFTSTTPKNPQVIAQEENELKEAIAKYAETEEDVFLANYMKEKKWVDPLSKTLKESSTSSKTPLSIDQEDELLDLEEDEKDLIEIDKFESKYNFRFEEMQNGVTICLALTTDSLQRKRTIWAL